MCVYCALFLFWWLSASTPEKSKVGTPPFFGPVGQRRRVSHPATNCRQQHGNSTKCSGQNPKTPDNTAICERLSRKRRNSANGFPSISGIAAPTSNASNVPVIVDTSHTALLTQLLAAGFGCVWPWLPILARVHLDTQTLHHQTLSLFVFCRVLCLLDGRRSIKKEGREQEIITQGVLISFFFVFGLVWFASRTAMEDLGILQRAGLCKRKSCLWLCLFWCAKLTPVALSFLCDLVCSCVQMPRLTVQRR